MEYTFDTEEEYVAYLNFMRSVLDLIPVVEKIQGTAKELAVEVRANFTDV